MSGPQLPGHHPPPPPARHPLLGLTPEARRQLARTLLAALDAQRAADRAGRTDAGMRGAGIVAATGLGLGLAWAGAGGAIAPFAAVYAALVAAQAAAGPALGRGAKPEADPAWVKAARAFALAPADAAAAVRAALVTDRVSPDRLVLAAGLLVAVRHPLSSSLLRRLMGRAYPVAEVEGAIALLVRGGWVAPAPAAPGVLVLTPAGIALLKGLGVTAPTTRVRRDPDIAPHLLPLFAALDQKGPRARRVEPDMPVAPAVAPAPAPVLPEPEPPKIVAFPTPPKPKTVELPKLAPVVVEEPPAELDELVVPELPSEAPARAPRRIPLPYLATAGMLALLGVLVYAFPPRAPQGPTELVRLNAALMPHSRGTAIQFNGRGALMSTFGGDLFLSIPERLDYKQAMTFKGFDMASECGLIDPDIRTARVSPLGRFIWIASGAGGRERCMVDLETKTVTHDLPARDAAYGLPYLVGWAGPQTLLMSQQPPPQRIARWWAVDVGAHRATPVDVPAHQRVLPLATEGGPALLAGFDAKGEGKWALTTYWLAGRGFNEIRRLQVELPEGRRDGAPHHGAISPDKRYLLLAMRSGGPGVAAPTGSLLVISLEDGAVTPLDVSAGPLIDQPLFWAPGVQDGHYRFYFNGDGPDGVVPLAGEMRVEPS